MELEVIIALVSVVVVILVQTGAVCYYFGSQAADTKTNTEDIKCIKSNYVTKGQCKGINNAWRVEVKSLMEQRDIFNAQNSKDHNTLILQGAEMVEAMERVKDCLHQMQLKQEC